MSPGRLSLGKADFDTPQDMAVNPPFLRKITMARIPLSYIYIFIVI
jgi:hypothetical protein